MVEEEDSLYEELAIEVDKKQSLLRIDKFLMDRMANVSRNKLQEAIRSEMVFVNDRFVKSNYKVKPGDRIVVMVPQRHDELEVLPEDIPLDVVHEDDHVLIVNKPPGMVVHPGYNNYSGTLVNALVFRFQDLPTSANGEAKPGLVHRIDKDTSGILVIAKSETAMTFLARQFADHSIERTYYALVWGLVENDSGTIRGNIGRSVMDRRVSVVYDDESLGKHAVTHYRVIKRMRYVTLVQCNLETGRTHQIRVHMKHIGHPLFGDVMYGGNKILKGDKFSRYKLFVEELFRLLPRQALHAKTLGFIHPSTRKHVQFDSDLPADMVEVIRRWEEYVQEG